MSNKISIRFYKDHKVRAVWDEWNNCWWFSVLDIVGAINNQDDREIFMKGIDYSYYYEQEE